MWQLRIFKNGAVIIAQVHKGASLDGDGALPVFTVREAKDAESLQVTACRLSRADNETYLIGSGPWSMKPFGGTIAEVYEASLWFAKLFARMYSVHQMGWRAEPVDAFDDDGEYWVLLQVAEKVRKGPKVGHKFAMTIKDGVIFRDHLSEQEYYEARKMH